MDLCDWCHCKHTNEGSEDFSFIWLSFYCMSDIGISLGVFPGHNHLLTTGTDAFICWCSGDNQSVRSSILVVSRWLWPGNMTFSEVASMVVTWWIVAKYSGLFAECDVSFLSQLWIYCIKCHTFGSLTPFYDTL